jgi:hypothetical protein
MSAEIFAAKALILHEPAEQLEKFIDLPWCKADEFYVQKLSLASAALRRTAEGESANRGE